MSDKQARGGAMADVKGRGDVQELREQIRDWRTAEVCVDAERGLVANIALAGLNSRNGYRYLEEALRGAVPLYNHKPVFLDHAPNAARPQERSTRDLVGHIVNPRYESGRIRGDVRVIDADAGRTFLALAASDAPAVGMSHVVLAERSTDRTVVEKIREVVSVDAVVFPATTATFRESGGGTLPPYGHSLEGFIEQIDAGLVWHVRRALKDEGAEVRRTGVFDECVVAEVRRADQEAELYAVEWSGGPGSVVLSGAPRPVTAVEVEGLRWMGRSGGDVLAKLEVERERLEREVERLRSEAAELETDRCARDVRREVEEVLKESRLPEYAVTEGFRRQLVEAADAGERMKLVAERRELLRQMRCHVPWSCERTAGAGRLPDAEFVAAVRRR